MDAEKGRATGRWRRAVQWWPLAVRRREDQVYLALALVIGALVGLAVVAFILLTERLGARLYPPGGAGWRRLPVPVLGALGMGVLLHRYFPEARGSGVPQTKAALFAGEGRITLKTVLGKFFCTATTLAAGIPLGREGPAVQVGAGIASVLGRRLGLSTARVKSLVPVGAAAAIAAAFNTPLAAVLFALEEVMGNLNAPVLGSVVLSSATSWMVLRLLLGNEPLFHVPQYQLVHPLEFGIYAVLGVAGGLVSVVFVKLLLGLRARFLRLPKGSGWFQPLAGGLAVGLAGWYVPQVLGVGYWYVGEALNSRMVLQLMALLVVLKVLTVTLSYASGNAGGIFGPSLFIGAMLGGTVGSVAHHFAPAYTSAPGAYALVGMGAAFAGIVRTPMTSVMMIFEVTRDYAIIVPLMISNLVSFFISHWLQPQPIYEALALQDGIHLPTAETREREDRYRVGHAMQPVAKTIAEDMMVAEALERMGRSEFRTWPVGTQKRVVGVVTAAKLQQLLDEGAGNRKMRDIMGEQKFPHVHSDQSLHLALQRMGGARLDLLPVVSRADVHELLGVVVLRDILKEYGVGHGNDS